jgi:hypothetical protein
MDEKYSNTISGLLRKRGEMLNEIRDVRERIAMLSNDLEGLERVLDTLGYDGELPTQSTRSARVVLFYRNELRSYLRSCLREHGPQTNRQMAVLLATKEGKDVKDRRLINDLTKR